MKSFEHIRKHLRYEGYDYSRFGAYFVTICTHEREHLFGEITQGSMNHNEIRRIVANNWSDLPRRFPCIAMDEWVIMPNHLHGIIWLAVGAQFIAPRPTIAPRPKPAPWAAPEDIATRNADASGGRGAINCAPTLGDIIRAFKAVSTHQIRSKRLAFGVWQRNYYDRIIRSNRELDAVRAYIHNNPEQWNKDEYH